MLAKLIDLAIANRIMVSVVTVLLLCAGVVVVPRLPVDAVPDVTNTQVSVLTEAPGLSAEQVERLVTIPIELGLNGLPHLEELRSVTRGGLSAVTVVFEDGTDIWFARQIILERVREIEGELPSSARAPQLGPVTTGLGEIYQFVLRSDRHTPMELRTMLQWDLAPRLRQVPGVIEVNPMGGAAKEFHVIIEPSRLAAYGLSLGEIVDALESNNVAVGGGWIERGAEQQVVRGESLLRDLSDIGSVVVSTDESGTPVLIRQLGTVVVGQALPYGIVTRDGEGEAVTGIVMMRLGANSRDVVYAVHARVEEIRATLPEGVAIDVVYDRASFIGRTLRTVGTNLIEGAALVGLVILIFLRSWRAALLVTLGIPFAMILAVMGMLAFGIDGSLMSLGAIDFGLLVDGPIVMVEAVLARFALDHVRAKEDPVGVVRESLQRVARPVVFSVLIILLVYVPLLSLEGVEGKMFRPMAATMGLALFGSVIFALLAFPAGAALMLKPGASHAHEEGKLEGWYRRALVWAVPHRLALIAASCCALLATAPVAGSLGADFVPRIDEGDIVVAARRIPSIGFSEARRLDLEMERVLHRFPEVETTVGMTGRAEVATDPVGLDNTDILVRLRPREEWTTAHDLDSLGEALKTAIETEVPSTFVSISQPIEDRTNELISGSRADVAILLFGDDLVRMTDLARRMARTLRATPGAGDVRVERALGLPMLEVQVDRGRLSRYGLDADDVLSVVEASRQGRQVGQVYEGQRRFPLRVLLPPGETTPEGFASVPVGAFGEQLVPLGVVADVTEVDGPSQVSRQGMSRRIRIEVNIRGRDLVSFVDDARARVSRDVPLPDGYRLEWGGQFENFQRATARLAIVLPVSLLLIFGMLFFTFGGPRYAIAVFTGVPFALIGGILALASRGMPFSIPAAVGFIALCGIAVLNGVVMASEVQRRVLEGETVEYAVREGAVTVLRAMLLTASVAAIGFFPMAISSSAGSEVQRPLATAVIGGVFSSTLLGLFVLPGLLRIFAPAKPHVPTSPADDG